MLRIGEQNIKGLRLGEQEIKKAYVGNSLVFESVPSSKLPNGYTELEYVQSTGSQYIDLGITSNSRQRFVMELRPDSSDNSDCILGSWYRTGSSNSYRFTFFELRFYSPNFILSMAYNNDKTSSQSHTKVSGLLNVKTTVDIDLKNKTISSGDSKLNINDFIPEYLNSNTMYLFANIRSFSGVLQPPNNYSYTTLYSFKAYDDDILIRDLIPCRDTDGNVGMYDTVSKKFLPGAGSQSLVAGPAV